ncbi:MAG: hypothetical protein JSR56_14210 [Proteobacteria bacterium]|nr:hypothetical protein [Pseudomonadota bacterium]
MPRTTTTPAAAMALVLAAMTSTWAVCGMHTAQATPSGACALLTANQVSTALGVPMSASGFGADANHCQWEQHGNGKQPANAVLLIESAQSYDMLKGIRAADRSLFAPASGVGDDAFYWGGTMLVTLYVKKGSKGFRVSLYGQGWSIPQIKAKEKSLAKAVLSKL